MVVAVSYTIEECFLLQIFLETEGKYHRATGKVSFHYLCRCVGYVIYVCIFFNHSCLDLKVRYI